MASARARSSNPLGAAFGWLGRMAPARKRMSSSILLAAMDRISPRSASPGKARRDSIILMKASEMSGAFSMGMAT